MTTTAHKQNHRMASVEAGATAKVAMSPSTVATASTPPSPASSEESAVVVAPTKNDIPAQLAEAVLVKSTDLSRSTRRPVGGYDFNDVVCPPSSCTARSSFSKELQEKEGVSPSAPSCSSSSAKGLAFVDYEKLLDSYLTSGFQAANYGKAVLEIRRMLEWSLASEPVASDEDEEFRDLEKRKSVRCKIFLAYTSNLISSGLREPLRFLFQHKLIQVATSSAGGIEEDLIKCLGATYDGAFDLDGVALRKQGLNRIGNLLVPNENYCLFEDWISPILHAMHDEQERDGVIWTPSTMIHRFGKEINDENSVCYWAYKNNIPLLCPSITDGSIGDMLYFHTFKRPGLVVDVVADIKRINDEAMKARKTGVIVLGGGMVKHHTMNANLMRNGCDYCVYVSTAQEFDGSDSGARPDEAKSWGKIRVDAKPVKVYADATLVFPLMVAQTFAQMRDCWPSAAGDEPIIYDKDYTATEHEAEKAKLGSPDGSVPEALNQ
ncbi:unnamed protein product [Amoebophrya sp. A25]|nr:unnamed protein product [Amoebophrya sp. A25]|eukprot:GSA25T00020082001.1